MSLFDELKRRNVFRVAVTYLIAAWLMLQVTDIVVPILGLPDWVSRFILLILVIGFVLALTLAWAYELTPDGIRRTDDVPTEKENGIANNRGYQINFWMTIILGLAVLFMAIDNYWFDNTEQSKRNLEFTETDAGQLMFYIEGPPDSQFSFFTASPQPALSSDGRQLAFAAPPAFAGRKGLSQETLDILWLQSIGELHARPLPGTEGAYAPFWSPDGRYVAYGTDSNGSIALNKYSVTGAVPETIAEVDGVWGGSWNSSGTIIYGAVEGIYSVPAEGGETRQVTRFTNGESDYAHRFPQFLPDGRRFIYLIVHPNPDIDGLYISSLDAAPDDQRRLTASDSNATLSTGADGRIYLLYVRDYALIAQAFDPESAELSGEPRLIASPIEPAQLMRFAPFASKNRNLVYRPKYQPDTTLTWFNRSGTPGEIIDLDDSALLFPALSRDGSKLAVVRDRATSESVWWFDLDRGGISERLTRESTAYLGVQWSSKADKVFYTRFDNEDGWDLFSKGLSAQQAEVPVHGTGDVSLLRDITADDRYIIFRRNGISAAPSGGAGNAINVINSEAAENHASVSPDGNWIAYSSTDPGEPSEIYVTSFPIAGDAVRVSPSGGVDPQWNAAGDELYYVSEDRNLMAVEIRSGEPIGQPIPLFRIEPDPFSIRWGSVYSPMPDGQRFLVNESIDAKPVRLVAIMNWDFEQ